MFLFHRFCTLQLYFYGSCSGESKIDFDIGYSKKYMLQKVHGAVSRLHKMYSMLFVIIIIVIYLLLLIDE